MEDILYIVGVILLFLVIAGLIIIKPYDKLDLTSKEEVDDAVRPSHKDDFIAGIDPIPGVVTVVNPKPKRTRAKSKKVTPVEVDQCELTEVDEVIVVKKPRKSKTTV